MSYHKALQKHMSPHTFPQKTTDVLNECSLLSNQICHQYYSTHKFWHAPLHFPWLSTYLYLEAQGDPNQTLLI